MTDAPLPSSAFAASTEPQLRLVRARGVYERRFKRLFDLVGVIALSSIALPILLAVALLVRLKLGSGVFYSQERIGRNGEVFTIWKFRTMRPDRRLRQDTIAEDRRQQHKADHDPRHTRLGRLLRKLSLDELPQLWNVLRGDMSLVGPRPEIRSVAEARGYVDHIRHEVRPGMTGPFQTSDLRLSGDLRDGLEADAEYVQSISFRQDVVYLLKTVTTMLGGSSQGS
jgi:lipopolysaccharide/colanic/teichoic acid biosynthesis glycosyltransferase